MHRLSQDILDWYYDQETGERRPILASGLSGQEHSTYQRRYYDRLYADGIMTPAATTSANSPVLAPRRPPPEPHRNPFAPPPGMASPTREDSVDGINCSPCCDNSNLRRTFRALLLGQILSLCLCGTGVASQLLTDKGINTPAAQNFCNYFLLCFVYCTALSCKAGDEGLLTVLRRRGWQYFLLALIDVEANYMIVYAYQFTTLTSVQLLDCFSIPVVLLLSWLFLSVRYLISHVIGVCICLLGIACLIWADILDGKGQIGGSNRVLGDLLCIGGTILYSIANVSEEYLVKQHNRLEYLGLVGLWGALISGVQLAILEHSALSHIDWSAGVAGSYALYAVCMFIFYSLVSYVLQKTSALMFNLSVLTADFYSLLFAIFLFKDSFHLLYFVSFAVVICGSIIYSLRSTQVRDADEPRRVCPCLFSACCCCCCSCCFDQDDESSHGSIQITPAAVNDSMAMYQAPAAANTRYCPVHGRRNGAPPSGAAAAPAAAPIQAQPRGNGVPAQLPPHMRNGFLNQA